MIILRNKVSKYLKTTYSKDELGKIVKYMAKTFPVKMRVVLKIVKLPYRGENAGMCTHYTLRGKSSALIEIFVNEHTTRSSLANTIAHELVHAQDLEDRGWSDEQWSYILGSSEGQKCITSLWPQPSIQPLWRTIH